MSEILKRVIALFLCIAVALGFVTNVWADSAVLSVVSVELRDKSETAEAETPSVSNNQIQGGLVFNAQDDYAEYLFVIENTDEYAYRIDSIEDNNSIDALNVAYTHDEKVSAGGVSRVTMRLTYSDMLLNQEAVDISDLKIQIHFTRIEETPEDPEDPEGPEDNPGGESGSESEKTININPNTDDGVTIFAFGTSAAIFVAMFALRNVLPRKARMLGDCLALVFAGGAFGIYVARAANVEELEIKFSNIHLASEYEEYTVLINTGNGPVSHQVRYGTPLSEILVRPTKTGYHFVNWTDANSNEVDENGIVQGPMSINANMAPNQYRIVFNSNNGASETSSQTLAYDSSENLNANSFTYAGYAFTGWATSADGEVVYTNGVEVSNLTTGTEDINLYAKWMKRTDISYTVRHRYEDLMDDDYTNEDISLEGSIETDYTPALQPRTGYVTPEQKTAQIAADGSTVIEYTYNLERKTLGLNDADCITTETPAGEYKYGYPISLTAKNREGYDFTGWSNGSSVVSTSATYEFEIHHNVTLTPNYQKKHFNVTINYNNGSALEVRDVEYGTVLSTILTEPSKTGHHFVKWIDGNNQDVDTSGTVTSELTVLAVFEANKYHVVFNANSSAATGTMASQEFTYSEAKNLTSNGFTWPGYTFDGWATSADGAVVYTDGQSVKNLTTGTEDINLYAKWTKRTDIHYTILHRYQKVIGDEYDEDVIDAYGSVDTDISPELLPRTGFETPEQITDQITADGNKIFTYTYARKVYHLTLENAEYITTETPAADYRYGREISLTAKDREGYNFLGWSNGSEIVSTNTNYSFTITSAVSLSPSYEIKKFTVVIDANDGSQITTYNNVEYGTTMSTLLPNQPSKTGHSFVNWMDGDNNVVTGETLVKGALTVTANYQANTYHVVFNPNGGTGEMGSQSFVYGTSQNLSQNSFERPGYTFDGWATSADGAVVYTNGQNVSNLTEGTNDINLYAVWNKRTDIHYAVLHHYQKAIGDDYDEDIVDAYGSVDTDISPELQPRTGFVTPDQITGQIAADGNTTFTYNYLRETHHLALGNADFIETDTPAGDYRYEYPIALTAKARTGYDFLGWHDGTSIVTENAVYSFSITSDVSLEPRYQIQSYAVTVIKSDGSAPQEYTLEYGTSLEAYLTTPSKTGYHFVNWTDGDNNVVTGETLVEGPMTITANLAPNSYDIVFDANGGSGVMGNQNMTYNTADLLTPNVFVRPGYTFEGWATSADGAIVFEDGDEALNLTTGTEDVILYAVWHLRTDIPYTVYHRYENIGTGFTEVEANEQGSVDTDITPPTAPQTGFNEPVADSSTPVPGQIQANGESFFVYNYYRQTRQLTINDSMYVITDTPSDNYKYGKEITLEATERVAYEFAGWQKVTSECEAPNCEVLSTEAEYTFELTEDTTIVPVYNYAPFYYAFKHDGACTIGGGAAVVGDDCGLHPELGYVDTGVKLYSEENYNLDYEIGFTVDALATEQVTQATFVNAKYEDSSSSAIGTGLVIRKGGQQPMDVTHAVNGSKYYKQHNAGEGATVKIIRYDGVIYYSINGGALIKAQSVRGTSDYKETVTWFGASYDNYTESPWRYLNGTLSHMYIKLGAYDGPTATMSFDANGSTVSPESITIPVGQTLKLAGYEMPTPSNNGSLYFVDWYLDKDVWGERVTEDTVLDSDMTVYARWEQSSHECAVFIGDETIYEDTLQECVNAVPDLTSENIEIAVLRDINPASVTVKSTKRIILDGRGHVLTSDSGTNSSPIIRNHGRLYIVNATLDGRAQQSTVNNGTTENPCNTSTCALYIDNSTITTSGTKQALWNKGGRVEIYGGSKIISTINKQPLHNLDGGVMRVIDATIEARTGDYPAIINEGTSTLIIGESGNGVRTDTPIIKSTNGSAITTSNAINFYDGTLIGKKHAISGSGAINAAAVANSPETGYVFTVINDGNTNQTTTMYYEASNGS